MIHCKWMAH